jgi:hypothetical protein
MGYGISMLAAVTVSLRQRYLADPRPWRVGFSGGKVNSLVARLIVGAVRSILIANGRAC